MKQAVKKLRGFLFIITFLGCLCTSYAQNQQLDSLKSLLNELKVDTFQVDVLNDMSYNILNLDPDQTIKYGK